MCCLCRGVDREVVEEGAHVVAEVLVVAVDGGVRLGGSPGAGSVDAGEDWGDDLIAQGEERGDGPRGLTGAAVARGHPHQLAAACP